MNDQQEESAISAAMAEGNKHGVKSTTSARIIAAYVDAQSGGAPAVVVAVEPFHTLNEDFEHFMAYSGTVPTEERLKMAYEHGNDRGMHYAVSPASATDDARTLAMVCDLFSIGSNARDRNTVLMNVANAVRRSSCLSAIEYNFFTATLKDDYGDEMEICALRWGDDRDQYIERFGAALAEKLATQLKAPDAAPPAPQQVVRQSALEKYKECTVDGEPESAVERLRFFCSCAMNGDDWLDVESFLNQVTDAALQSTPQGATK